MNTSQDTHSNRDILTQVTAHGHRTISEELTTLYHVGDLSGTREKPYYSQEGKEIAVSPCPDTWKRITELEGDTYELRNPTATFYFIDPETSVTNAELCVCCKHDFITMKKGAVLKQYDIEYDTTRYWKHYNKTDAVTQAKNRDLHQEESITETYLPHVSTRGREYCKEAFTQPVSELTPIAVESLVPIWSVMTLTQNGDIDGVFWNNPNRPDKHTAKRGLIFQSNINDWEIYNLTTKNRVTVK